MVVRFEVDAFMEEETHSPNTSTDEEPLSDSAEVENPPSSPPRDAEKTISIDTVPPNQAEQPDPARQSLSGTEDVALWGSESTADHAFPEDAAPQGGPTDEPGLEGPVDLVNTDTKPKESNSVNDGAAVWEEPQSDAALWGPASDDPAAWGPAPDDPSAWASPQEDPGAWRPPATTPPGPPAELNVVRAGTLVPQSSILEFATRSARWLDRTRVDDTFLQLFLTQTPAHHIAVHERGTFDRVDRQELASAEFAAIAQSAAVRASLMRFVTVLRKVQELVKVHGQAGQVSLVCERGKLEMFGRMGQEGLLGEKELERFSTGSKN